MLARILATLGALICWSGLGIQFDILVTGPLGPIGGTWRFIAFFTVVMNLLAACLFTLAVFEPSMSVLRARLVADGLLHYAAPAVAVLFWFACVPKSGLRWSDPLRWTSIPLLYLVYALARASADGFYPYFFIDLSQLGWQKMLTNAVGMLIAFFVLGVAMMALGRRRGHRGTATQEATGK